jgi:L-lactate utilization protein LutB
MHGVYQLTKLHAACHRVWHILARFTQNYEQRVAKLVDEPPKFDQVHEGFATLTQRAIEALADLIFLDVNKSLASVGTRQWYASSRWPTALCASLSL